MVSRFRLSLAAIAILVLSTSLSAQNVITEWNTVAWRTIIVASPAVGGSKAPGAAGVWFAYAAIAEYDAVNAIRQQYQPFYYSGPAPQGASEAAAAVAAAHRVLVHYFPLQQINLDAAFSESLARIADSDSAKDDGVLAGEASAAALIEARANDGLEANVPYTPGSGPGVWQPTPPAFAPAATPWLAVMQPFTMGSPSQFRPGPPPSLGSDEWVANYEFVRRFGSVNSAERTPEQTESAIFWTENTPQQYSRVFNFLALYYQLDVLESSRLMAALWTGVSDAAIGCYDAKFAYNFWRPVTAIRAGGANPALSADASWTPLARTPNHPEYPSNHSCITGAVSTLIANYFGTRSVHIVVDSLAFNPPHTHVFDDTHDLIDHVSMARIYAGFHYRFSTDAGATMGKAIAQHLYATKFRRPIPASTHSKTSD